MVIKKKRKMLLPVLIGLTILVTIGCGQKKAADEKAPDPVLSDGEAEPEQPEQPEEVPVRQEPPQPEEIEADGMTEADNEEPAFPEATFGEVDAEDMESVDGVTMTVIKATSEGADLEIVNRTDKEVSFGEDYELQVWKDENWYQVEYIIDNWAFHMTAYIPEKDEPMQMDVTWTYFHGILPKGHYRITKTADIQEAEGPVKFRLAAEFTIE